MAMRSVVSRTSVRRLMEGTGRYTTSGLRYFSEDKGRILSEEERAIENVYIQKVERERMEKQKAKADKEKTGKEKGQKKIEGDTHQI